MKERVPWFVVENPFVVIYLFELIVRILSAISGGSAPVPSRRWGSSCAARRGQWST